MITLTTGVRSIVDAIYKNNEYITTLQKEIASASMPTDLVSISLSQEAQDLLNRNEVIINAITVITLAKTAIEKVKQLIEDNIDKNGKVKNLSDLREEIEDTIDGVTLLNNGTVSTRSIIVEGIDASLSELGINNVNDDPEVAFSILDNFMSELDSKLAILNVRKEFNSSKYDIIMQGNAVDLTEVNAALLSVQVKQQLLYNVLNISLEAEKNILKLFE